MIGRDEELLFPDQRSPSPLFYKTVIHGREEKLVDIRGGISWPVANMLGYFILVAQLEEQDENHDWRFFVFAEDRANEVKDFFEKISSACLTWRIARLCHGDGPGEKDFSRQLYDYLKRKKKKYQIIEMPSIGPMGQALKLPWFQRCKKADFLAQLIRKHIADKTLTFPAPSQNRVSLLVDKVRHVDVDADILKIPELKALAFVMDDFNLSPWQPPEPEKKKDYS